MKWVVIMVCALMFFSEESIAQIYNSEVEAKINTEAVAERLQISGTAFNKTQLNQSLRYVLSVIRTDAETSNRSKNDQSNRFVLEPGETKNLSQTTINVNNDDKVIVLLLVYDVDDNILGKDRIVFNETKPDDKRVIKKEAIAIVETEVDAKDIGVIRGIVVEDTKTKPGRDFYKAFTSIYSAKKINGEGVVTIKEVLALGSNTKIQMMVGDDIVFQFFVNPRADYLDNMANQAVGRIVQYFIVAEKNKNFQKRY